MVQLLICVSYESCAERSLYYGFNSEKNIIMYSVFFVLFSPSSD